MATFRGISLQKRAHWKTSIVEIQMGEKWVRKSVNEEIPCVYPLPGYCSGSDTRNIWLFFEEQ